MPSGRFSAQKPTYRNARNRSSLEVRREAIAFSWKQLHIPDVRRTTHKRRIIIDRRTGANKCLVRNCKIAGIKLCEALRLQHGFDAISLMPTNLYGPGDNYETSRSHVLPALIKRFHDAKKTQTNR